MDDYPYSDKGGDTTETCKLVDGVHGTELAVTAQTGKMLDFYDPDFAPSADEKPAVSEDEKLEVSQGEKLAVAEDKKLEVDEDEK